MPRAATSSDSASLVMGSRVVHVMGTVVSFDLRVPVPAAAFTEAVEVLHRADRRFSTYQPDSDISRLRRGEATVEECHPDVAEVLGLCLAATEQTDRYFTAFPHGELDPTGLVKGWAIQQASQVLDEAGSTWHAVNGGGDIQFAGGREGHHEWRVAIADPWDNGRAIAVAACRAGGIATSGTAERGQHIVNPRTGMTARYFASVTVTADTLLDADVIATAAFARGEGAPQWIEKMRGVEALFVGPDRSLTMTSGFPSV